MPGLRGRAAHTVTDADTAIAMRSGEVPTLATPRLVALMEERTEARKARDFERADAIRDELTAEGWTIEDTPKGPRLKSI